LTVRINISSGHGLHVRGASGLIDEVDEARRVVPRVADHLRRHGHAVLEIHDDVSTTQQANLEYLVARHNEHSRDLDVSVHFNAYVETEGPRGTEVLYVTQADLAARVSVAIAKAGDLIDRGAHKRTDLYFLNHTTAPAILIEVCFVDSVEDVDHYETHFEAIVRAIAALAGSTRPLMASTVHGPCSWFGGPDDDGVSPNEGLAFFYEYEDAPHLFLVEQPAGTTGLARRLDPNVYYVACRWDYDITPKTMLADMRNMALVSNGRRAIRAWPADWGPHEDTGRVADISPGLMQALGIETDDEITVIYPAPRD